MKIKEKYIKLNLYWLFVINCVIYILSLWIEFRYIFTNNFYKTSLSKTLHSENQISDYIVRDRGLDWLNYGFIPVMVFSTACLVSLCLFVGFNIFEEKISLKDSFRISLQSIIVFPLNYLITALLKVFHILPYKFENVNDVYKYQSGLCFFKVDKLPQWAIYPLEKINLTEIVYFIVLAVFISLYFHFSWKKSFKYSVLIYGIGLFVWVIFSVFIKIVFFM